NTNTIEVNSFVKSLTKNANKEKIKADETANLPLKENIINIDDLLNISENIIDNTFITFAAPILNAKK
ncbi:4281_t:CDS:1, partial [Funneliformis caledonium]